MKRIAVPVALVGLCLALVWAAGNDRAGAMVLRGAARDFTIHPGDVHQTMIGFGAGFNEVAEQLMENIANPSDRTLAYDLLYGEVSPLGAAAIKGTRLNIVRLVVPPDAKQISTSGMPHYDWANDTGAQSEWTAIKPIFQLTTPILYAVPFTPPAEWKTKPGNAIQLPMPKLDTGGALSGGSLRPEHYRDYAEYLADFLLYWRDTLGHEIAVLSIQNEPGVPSPWHSCVWTPEEMRAFAVVLGDTLQKRGLKTKLMLSEGTNWSGAWSHLEPSLNDQAARQYIGALASHSYNDPVDPKFDNDKPRQRFANASVQYGIPVWTSEMSLMQKPHELHDDPTMKAALAVAYYIHRDVTAARASAWIYCFAIFRSAFPGSMGVLSPADGKAMGHLEVPKRFWAMANYSQFVRPGWRAVGLDGELPNDPILNTGFVGPEGKRFVLVAVNLSLKPQGVHYTFDGKAIGGLKTHITSETQDLAPGATPAVGQSEFTATLPPQSVTTFEGTLSP